MLFVWIWCQVDQVNGPELASSWVKVALICPVMARLRHREDTGMSIDVINIGLIKWQMLCGLDSIDADQCELLMDPCDAR